MRKIKSLDDLKEKVIQTQIKAKEDLLDDLSKKSIFKLNEKLTKLRHRVLYVHFMLEFFIGLILSEWSLKLVAPKLTDNEIMYSAYYAEKISDEVDFARKVNLLRSENVTPKELHKYIKDINDYRNWFAHPKKFHRELERLSNDSKEYLKVLRTLIEAWEGITGLYFARHDGLRKRDLLSAAMGGLSQSATVQNTKE